MRLLLITSLLIFISCGKNNELKSSSANNTIELKSFITVTHEEGKSNFRNKLLNQIVEETFPSENKDIKIKRYDELETYPIDTRDLNNYKAKEKTMAKIIVSFSSRWEIYFLAEGIPVQELAAKLALQADPDHSFKLLQTNFLKTTKGETFYLISVNHSDLMINDQKFYKQESDFKNKFSNQKIKLDGSKKIEFTVSYSYLTQQLALKDFSKQISTRSSKGCWEDGSCATYCEYKMNVPSNEFVKDNSSSLNNLGFSVKVNGKVFSLESLNAEKTTADSFRFSIVESESTLGESGLEILTTAIPSTQVFTPGTNCGINGTANIEHRAEFSVIMEVWGRGEELRKIKL
jgi:hypothetical protein